MTTAKRFIKRRLSQIRITAMDSGTKIPRSKNEIRLFMVVRNEMLRLPYTLRYYFDHGVDRAIIIDNSSEDGTLEWLQQQDRVHLFKTSDSFRHKVSWIDWMLKKYGVGCWCLVVDADEILVYPGAEQMSLPGVISFLESQQVTALDSVLLDMYPKGPISQTFYVVGDNMIAATPFFDPPDYKEEPYAFFRCLTKYTHRLSGGGPRERIFGIRTCSSKVPLFKMFSSSFLHDGQHAIEGAKLSNVRGVLLHFKYLQDFKERTLLEASREEHYDNASEYKIYASHINGESSPNFWHKNSIQYQDEYQLRKLGIMKTSDAFDKFCKDKGNQNTKKCFCIM